MQHQGLDISAIPTLPEGSVLTGRRATTEQFQQAHNVIAPVLIRYLRQGLISLDNMLGKPSNETAASLHGSVQQEIARRNAAGIGYILIFFGYRNSHFIVITAEDFDRLLSWVRRSNAFIPGNISTTLPIVVLSMQVIESTSIFQAPPTSLWRESFTILGHRILLNTTKTHVQAF